MDSHLPLMFPSLKAFANNSQHIEHRWSVSGTRLVKTPGNSDVSVPRVQSGWWLVWAWVSKRQEPLSGSKKKVQEASKRDKVMEGRQWVSAFSFGESEQDFEFNEKFQGQGNRELEMGGSQVCIEGEQGETVEVQREGGGLNTKVGALASRGTTHLQSRTTGHPQCHSHD